MQKHAFRLTTAVAAATLAACTASQQPAPIIDGNRSAAAPTADSAANNPYGAQPYNPNAVPNVAPYTPPVQAAAPVVQPAPVVQQPAAAPVVKPYSGNYAPVDVNAATHRVTVGDTVYNISRRYGISQDDLRAWNGLSGNNINVGQDLRVKPSGYRAPAAPVAPAAKPNSGNYAPVDVNAATHRVVSGDTVYNISRRYGISQDDLRAWNGLSGNNISIGQNLRVRAAGSAPAPSVQPAVTAPVVVKPAVTVTPTAPAAPTKPAASATPAPAPTAPAVTAGAGNQAAGITWQSPTAGKVVKNFGGNSKGVDIAGSRGQDVLAAADGRVVYAGSGLRGYGNLLIIQHNKVYLTAYGHNDSLLVQEGQNVKRGQVVAKMGSSDSDSVKLHFEVRENGTPVNPTRFVRF